MNRRLEGPAGGTCHQDHLGQCQAILQPLTLKGEGESCWVCRYADTP